MKEGETNVYHIYTTRGLCMNYNSYEHGTQKVHELGHFQSIKYVAMSISTRNN